MHKLAINRARIDLTFTPVTPLLVKAGDKAGALLHPERPDLMCVRTQHARFGETVYIPGSSIKGVVRAAAERILRSLEAPCCDPLDHKSPCHEEASKLGDERARGKVPPEEREHPMASVHAKVCLACRTFGSQALASRASFADAYPTSETAWRANQTETRSGVAIDRATGGPSPKKLFELEVVTGGVFETFIVLANYELWQLALVTAVLREIDDGFIRIGSAKTRGLGLVKCEVGRLLVDQKGPGHSLAGVAALLPTLVVPYGLRERDQRVSIESRPLPGALGSRFALAGPEARRALDAVMTTAWPVLAGGAP
jgi:CRISPR-associated RAMP protein (TIGR02581 family)